MTRRGWTKVWLELLTLSAFAFSQPLFDILGRQAAFFVAHRANGATLLLFTAMLLLAPPTLLLGTVRLADIASPRAGRWLHHFLIGVLVALTVAPPVARAFHLGPFAWTAVFAFLMAVAVWGYINSSLAREAVSWAIIAPAGFAAVFLFGSPVRQLVATTTFSRASTTAGSDVPVIVLVLDELPLGALLRPDGAIDASRFPNFARLAKQSTWYGQATTNADGTIYAVPALLTGRWLEADRLPTAQSFPDNLLSYFGRSYPVHAMEFVTSLCPDDVCRDASPPRFQSLMADAAIVYLHATLPQSVAAAHLPSIAGRWAGFSGVDDPPAASAPSDTVESMIRRATKGDELARFKVFLEQLAPGADRGLWYLHVGLPHVPWRLLPSGQAYDGMNVPGLTLQESWAPDQGAVDQGLQRFLLQLVYVDRLLGQLLDRLVAAHLDSRALLVVAADHGGAFIPGQARRDITPDTAPEILPIPLFIRYPGQREGRTDARNAELVDVLPTIADVVSMPVPWAMEGTSLRSAGAGRAEKHVYTRLHGLTALPAHVGGVERLAARMDALFGPGGDEDDLYRMGPYRDLVGQAAADFVRSSVRPPAARLRIDRPEAYASVDPGSNFVPALVTASIAGDLPGGVPAAVAVNGTIAGVGWTQQAHGKTSLSVMLSPRFLRPGRNFVTAYTITPQGALTPIEPEDSAPYRLLEANGHIAAIGAPDGRILPVQRERFQGQVDRYVRTGSSVQILGWAVDPGRQRTPIAFIVARQRTPIATSRPWPRDDVAAYFKSPALTDCGLQLSIAAPAEDHVEVFALFDDAAFQLPWSAQ